MTEKTSGTVSLPDSPSSMAKWTLFLATTLYQDIHQRHIYCPVQMALNRALHPMSLPAGGHVRGFYVFATSFLRILWNYQTVVAVFSPIKHVYRLRGRIVKDKKLLLG
jgi:hypothetical protein